VNQVLELEQAILARAQQLADQYAGQAQKMRDTILREAEDRLRQREQREEAIARELGERHYRQRVQAAELRLQSNLDRMRWNLVRRVEDRLAERMQALIENERAYLEHLRALLRAGAEEFESDSITVRCNAEDRERLQAHWSGIEAELPGKKLRLDDDPIETLGGVLLESADRRIRVNNTFEGRTARLRLRLQQAILERLLPASPESGNLFTG
jgi:V/A-type H+/Na+-transporting ATPase subunit E